MSHHRPEDDRRAYQRGQSPVRPLWELIEWGQLFPVVDVERDQHEYVREPHSGDVQSCPAAQSATTCFAADERRKE